MGRHCRACGKFVRKGVKHCSRYCMGVAQRGKSREDRSSPSRKVYVQIINEQGRREYLHRYIWRNHNGEIPEGMVVHHKDENPRNTSIENLESRPRNEHTPHAHFHWKTRDWQDPDNYIPLDGDAAEDIEFWSNLDR
jgi:hypothetical protein